MAYPVEADRNGDCFLCGFPLGTPPDLDWHGLGNCVEVCPTCGGTGDGKLYDDEEGPVACETCKGSGGVPFPVGG